MVRSAALIVLLNFFGVAPAYALNIDLALLAGPNYSFPEDSYGASSEGRLGYAIGSLIGLGKKRARLRFESGAILSSRRHHVGSQDVQMTLLEIPLQARVAMSPRVSTGLGLYYGFGLGAVRVTDTNGRTVSKDFEAARLNRDEFGAVADVKVKLTRNRKWGPFFEARFAGSILNVAEKGTYRHRQVQALLGLELGGGSP